MSTPRNQAANGAPTPSTTGRRIALVVGVNSAPRASLLAPLEYAAADAEEMAIVLQQDCDFELLRFEDMPQYTNPLTGEAATTANVKDAILELARDRNDDDFLLFYFSGHGVKLEVEARREEVYLGTYDFKEQVVKDDENRHISFKWLHDKLYERTNAGSVLIILDCCYSGEMGKTAPDLYLEEIKQRLRVYFDAPGAESIAPPDGLRWTLASTGQNTTAKEQDGHGLMTGLLLAALRGERENAMDQKGQVPLELLNYSLREWYVEKQVPPVQRPSLWGGDSGRTCILAFHPERRQQEKLQGMSQQLTTGMTALPTDYAARIQNFLTEYLGTPERPVPFGGREGDVGRLNAWLDGSKQPPYLLLAAPAGRGKSALLVRWSNSLLTRKDLAVIFLPVSIRFRTNLAGVVFSALTARLAYLHGEKVPATPDTPLEVWRGLMTDYLTRPLPDGRRLLLILDGVDEAAGWEAAPDLFPLAPPRGLQIVLSARYLAGDTDARLWLSRLGWTRSSLARPVELYPLTVRGVADVLQRMAFPLDRLGARIDIVTELYRLSEGDPLLVRLYVDDLWERGEEAARLQCEDLGAISPGLEGYFARWWEDQRSLWGNQMPLRERAVQALLSLLAGALGPLTMDDILRLAPPDAGLTSWTLEDHLHPLKRFVVGDGRRQGYVFNHPRLGIYFYEERLTERDRQDIEARFLSWGAETLTTLNDGRLAPAQASQYIVQYYGAHLERAASRADAMLALVSKGWLHAWKALEDTYAGFLNDTGRAWKTVERDDKAAITRGQLAPYIGGEVSCALCQASVNSLAKNIPPILLVHVVEQEIWTATQGLAYARHIPDLEQRTKALIQLLPYLPDVLKSNVIQEAVIAARAIASERVRVRTLAALAPQLSQEMREEIQQEALETARAIEDQKAKALALIAILSYIPDVLKEGVICEILQVAQAMKDDDDTFMVLLTIAPHVPATLIQQMQDIVWTLDDEEEQAAILVALAPQLSEALLRETLEIARDSSDDILSAMLPLLIPYMPETLKGEVIQMSLKITRAMEGAEQALVLPSLIPYLPEAVKHEIIQDALETIRMTEEDDADSVFLLITLVPHLSEMLLQKTVVVARAMRSETSRVLFLAILAPRLPVSMRDDVLREVLEIARTIREEDIWTQVLEALVPYLSEPLLREALEAAQTIRDEAEQLRTQVMLAPYLSEQLLLLVLQATRMIKDRNTQTHLLASLVPHLPKALKEQVVQEVLTTVRAIGEKGLRIQALTLILPCLSESQREGVTQEILAVIATIREKVVRVEGFIQLLPHLSEGQKETVIGETLQLVWTIDESEYKAEVTAYAEMRTQALLEVLPSLPETQRSEVVQEALESARRINKKRERAQALAALIPYLPQNQRDEEAQELFKIIQSGEENNSSIVTTIASLLSTDRQQEALDMVYAIKDRVDQAQAFLELLPSLSDIFRESVIHELLTAAQALKIEAEQLQYRDLMKSRTQALVGLTSHLSPTLQKEVVQEALEIAHSIDKQELWPRTLATLAPYVPEQLREEAVDIALTIRDGAERAGILTTLLPYLSEERKEQVEQVALATALAIRDREEHVVALVALLPHLTGTVQQETALEAFEVIGRIGTSVSSVQLHATLLPYLPEAQKQEATQKVLKAFLTQEDRERYYPSSGRILSMAMPYLSEIQRKEVVEVVLGTVEMLEERLAERKVPDPYEYGIMVSSLEILPYLSDTQRTDIIKRVLGLAKKISVDHTLLLKALQPYLSKTQADEMAQEMLASVRNEQDARYRVQGLAELLPFLSPILKEGVEREKEEVEREAIAVARTIQVGVSEQVQEMLSMRVQVLVGVIPYLPENQQPEMVQEALKSVRETKDLALDPWDPYGYKTNSKFVSRGEMLAVLVPYLFEKQQEEVVQEAVQAMWMAGTIDRKIRLLMMLIPYLTEARLGNIVKEEFLEVAPTERWSNSWRSVEDMTVESWSKLASCLPETQRKEVVREAMKQAGKLSKPDERLRALVALLPLISTSRQEAMRQEALALAREIEDNTRRAHALVTLLPYLSGKQKTEVAQEALETARAIRKPEDEAISKVKKGTRVRALVALVPHMSEELLQQVVDTAQQLLTFDEQVQVLVALLPAVSKQQDIVSKFLKGTSTTEDSWGRREPMQMLALAAYLPEHEKDRLVQETLAAVQTIEKAPQKVQQYALLLPLLSGHTKEEVLQEALDSARTIEEDISGEIEALTPLFPVLSNPLLQEAIKADNTIEYEQSRAQALMRLFSHLSEKQKGEVLGELLEATQVLPKGDQAHVLEELLSHLTNLATATLYASWNEILHLLSRNARQDLLAGIQVLAPIIVKLGGTEAAAATSRAILDIGQWWS